MTEFLESNDIFVGFAGPDRFITRGGLATIDDYDFFGGDRDTLVTGDAVLDAAFSADGGMAIVTLLEDPNYFATPLNRGFTTLSAPLFNLNLTSLDDEILFAFE